MKTKLNIKNFRIFDEKGVTFDLDPITILTGRNSAGKSTVVKAVFLLASYLGQIKKVIERGEPIKFSNFKLDFTSYPNNLLGRFGKIVNDKSKTKEITFEYTVYSLFLSKDVTVSMTFAAQDDDKLNNGYLKYYSISIDNGEIFSSDDYGYAYNLNLVSSELTEFFVIYALIDSYTAATSGYSMEHSISKEDYEKITTGNSKLLNLLERKPDVLKYIRFNEPKEGLIRFSKDIAATSQSMLWCHDNNSLYNIPILKVLDGIHKRDFVSYIQKEIIDEHKSTIFICENKASKSRFTYVNKVKEFGPIGDDYVKAAEQDIKDATMMIAKDFVASDDKKFSDYFKRHEHDYYNRDNRARMPRYKSSAIFNTFIYNREHFGLDVLNKELIRRPSRATDILQSYIEGMGGWRNEPISFNLIYEMVMEWNAALFPRKRSKDYIYVDPKRYEYEYGVGYFSHHSDELFATLVENFIYEVLAPDWCDKLQYVSSSYTVVKRIYDIADNDDFSKLVQRYFNAKNSLLESQKTATSGFVPIPRPSDYKPDSFMTYWLRKLELGHKLSIKKDNDGFGVQLRLHKHTKDRKGRLLAEEGFGITQLCRFLLEIEAAIMSAKCVSTNNTIGLKDLDGYDEEKFHYEISTIAIEEPEVHLHPQFQSWLAEMFLEAYEKYNIHFIIETHSEYLIRKSQVIVANKKYESDEAMEKDNPFKVYYVPNDAKPYEMKYRTDGKFSNEFGTGFFDEASNLLYDIL